MKLSNMCTKLKVKDNINARPSQQESRIAQKQTMDRQTTTKEVLQCFNRKKLNLTIINMFETMMTTFDGIFRGVEFDSVLQLNSNVSHFRMLRPKTISRAHQLEHH